MLTDQDRAILELAARYPTGGAGLTRAARDQLGLLPTRFYQRLDRVIRTRDGIEHDPLTCALFRARADDV